MHIIGNYVFDSDRLIIYKSDIDEQIKLEGGGRI